MSGSDVTRCMCVCVQSSSNVCGREYPLRIESPDGGVCDFTHTPIHPLNVIVSCSVMSHFDVTTTTFLTGCDVTLTSQLGGGVCGS